MPDGEVVWKMSLNLFGQIIEKLTGKADPEKQSRDQLIKELNLHFVNCTNEEKDEIIKFLKGLEHE